MLRGLLGLLLVGALAACTDRGLLAGPTLEPLDVQPEGTWLRDRRGRVVLLRGITLPPLVPGSFVEQPDGPAEEDFAHYERAGLNVVRVLLSWDSFEWEPGTFDVGYLMERVNPVVRLAAKRGMLAILAMDGRPGGAGVSLCDLLERDAAGEPEPRARFVAGWKQIVRLYAADRRIVGLDLLEEPREEACASGTTGELLLGVYREIARSLRLREARATLFFEPTVAPGRLLPAAIPGRRTATVLAPHFFSQAFGAPPGSRVATIARTYAEGAALAAANAVVLFAGEIGADEPPRPDGFRPTSATFVRDSFAALDRHLAGGTVRLAGGGEPKSPSVAATLLAVKRPWARRIAGIPTAMRLDAAKRSFLLAFRDDPARRVADPTELFVPRDFYPEGFTVRVLPSGRWTYDEHSERLLVYRSDASGHAVWIDPAAEVPDAPED
jgi:hypothetical protein